MLVLQVPSFISETKWHLILGGAGSPNTVELFNWHTLEQCQLPNLPFGAAGHVATSLEGVPVFCEAGAASRSCFKMDKITKKWLPVSFSRDYSKDTKLR